MILPEGFDRVCFLYAIREHVMPELESMAKRDQDRALYNAALNYGALFDALPATIDENYPIETFNYMDLAIKSITTQCHSAGYSDQKIQGLLQDSPEKVRAAADCYLAMAYLAMRHYPLYAIHQTLQRWNDSDIDMELQALLSE